MKTVNKELVQQYIDKQISLVNAVFIELQKAKGYHVMPDVEKEDLNSFAVENYLLVSHKKRPYIAYTSYALDVAKKHRDGLMLLAGVYDYDLVINMLKLAGVECCESETARYIDICLVPNDAVIRTMLIDQWLEDNKD